ncbi:MAG: hypothetical protein K0R50_1482 [Eubacterium sp.]|jgi:hypothetical protein|nr:hypothetical protein [Eubacterium sp.]
MGEITKNDNKFIGYEYKDITVKRNMESVYVDGYTNFGWTLEGTSAPIQSVGSVTLKFKRDRKLRNKAELTRLQRHFDSCITEIQRLEFSKVLRASAVAYIIGLFGTAFMAGSVFAVTANMVPLCILLAIPAFVGWIIPYFCYCSMCRKKTDQVEPLIDKKYDEIYEICEKANNLLAK